MFEGKNCLPTPNSWQGHHVGWRGHSIGRSNRYHLYNPIQSQY